MKCIKKMSWCLINIDNTFLKVNASGDIQRKMKSGNWKDVENICNHMNGMNVIVINKKMVLIIQSHIK